MDPQHMQEQASEQRQRELGSIFSTVAINWFQVKSRSVTEDYAKDIWRSLKKDVFPASLANTMQVRAGAISMLIKHERIDISEAAKVVYEKMTQKLERQKALEQREDSDGEQRLE